MQCCIIIILEVATLNIKIWRHETIFNSNQSIKTDMSKYTRKFSSFKIIYLHYNMLDLSILVTCLECTNAMRVPLYKTHTTITNINVFFCEDTIVHWMVKCAMSCIFMIFTVYDSICLNTIVCIICWWVWSLY